MDIANPYGFGQAPIVYEGTAPHDGLRTFYALLAVGYGEWLKDWTFPEGDERNAFKTLDDMAKWNDAHNSVSHPRTIERAESGLLMLSTLAFADYWITRKQYLLVQSRVWTRLVRAQRSTITASQLCPSLKSYS